MELILKFTEFDVDDVETWPNKESKIMLFRDTGFLGKHDARYCYGMFVFTTIKGWHSRSYPDGFYAHVLNEMTEEWEEEIKHGDKWAYVACL